MRPSNLASLQRHLKFLEVKVNTIEDIGGGGIRCMLAGVHFNEINKNWEHESWHFVKIYHIVWIFIYLPLHNQTRPKWNDFNNPVQFSFMTDCLSEYEWKTSTLFLIISDLTIFDRELISGCGPKICLLLLLSLIHFFSDFSKCVTLRYTSNIWWNIFSWSGFEIPNLAFYDEINEYSSVDKNEICE